MEVVAFAVLAVAGGDLASIQMDESDDALIFADSLVC